MLPVDAEQSPVVNSSRKKTPGENLAAVGEFGARVRCARLRALDPPPPVASSFRNELVPPLPPGLGETCSRRCAAMGGTASGRLLLEKARLRLRRDGLHPAAAAEGRA